MTCGRFQASCGLLIAVCSALLCAHTATATATRFSALYVFGDSWTDDNGVNGTWKAFKLPPTPPNLYKWSNGPTFPFYVARDGGLSCNWADANTSTGIRCSTYVNFGQGGACASPYTGNVAVKAACTAGTFFSLSLPEQITEFETAQLNISSNDLFLINVGGNDMNGWLNANGFGAKVDAIVNEPSEARANILDAVRRLFNRGGRRFFLTNVVDLLSTPRGMAAAASMNALSVEFADEFIENYVKQFGVEVIQAARTQFPSATIYYGNLRGCMKQKSKGDYGGWAADGFTQVTTPCAADRNNPNSTICADVDSTLWWDPVHPTTRWHQWLGGQVLRILDGGNETNTCLATKCIGDSIFDDCYKSAAFAARPNFVLVLAVVLASVVFGLIML